MKLLLYKAKGKLGNLLIRLWTDSVYSHCEIEIDGLCYSSSAMDGGVRAKKIVIDPANWDEIELGDSLKPLVLEFFERTKGFKYGWWDLVVSQIFNRGRNEKSKYFCSEWCAEALGLPNSTIYSPKTLQEIIKFILNNKNLKSEI